MSCLYSAAIQQPTSNTEASRLSNNDVRLNHEEKV